MEHTPTQLPAKELRVALFDLAHKSLVSFTARPQLIVDTEHSLYEHSDTLESRQITDEHRAESILSRNQKIMDSIAPDESEFALPRRWRVLKVLGRLSTKEANVTGYAVALPQPIDLPRFGVFYPYDLQRLQAYTQKVTDYPERHDEKFMDPIDAELIHSGLMRINELKRAAS